MLPTAEQCTQMGGTIEPGRKLKVDRYSYLVVVIANVSLIESGIIDDVLVVDIDTHLS